MPDLSRPQSVDQDTADFFDSLVPGHRDYLLELRALAYQTAEADTRIGLLSETLKWNQPSYLPVKPRVGTAVRLGTFGTNHVAMFVNCQTTLVNHWRESLPHLSYSKTRAIVLNPNATMPTAELQQCMGEAFTYKLR